MIKTLAAPALWLDLRSGSKPIRYNILMDPFHLIPQYRDYVWGGRRLRPHHALQTAEAWIVYEENFIASGPHHGMTLAQAARESGQELLGKKAVARTGLRFPLLIKILDCAEWLSLQVHPDDRQARDLAGDGQFGKTEAWHVLQAQMGAQLIAGLIPGAGSSELKEAVLSGAVIDMVQYLDVQAGDTVLILPGTVHALGPGLMIYEVQQTSDLTYRVYDWGRPQTAERRLHIHESLQVVDAKRQSQVIPLPDIRDGQAAILCQSDYFQLKRLFSKAEPIEFDTKGESFHALTAIQGEGVVTVSGKAYRLAQFDTLVIPADRGPYTAQAYTSDFHALLAMVP